MAKWLSDEGHDVVGAWVWEPDPGDEALLTLATAEDRILVTINTDFGDLVFSQKTRPRYGGGCHPATTQRRRAGKM